VFEVSSFDVMVPYFAPRTRPFGMAERHQNHHKQRGMAPHEGGEVALALLFRKEVSTESRAVDCTAWLKCATDF
jgi:hypothetical protein